MAVKSHSQNLHKSLMLALIVVLMATTGIIVFASLQGNQDIRGRAYSPPPIPEGGTCGKGVAGRCDMSAGLTCNAPPDGIGKCVKSSSCFQSCMALNHDSNRCDLNCNIPTPTPTQTPQKCFQSCMASKHDSNQCDRDCNIPTPTPTKTPQACFQSCMALNHDSNRCDLNCNIPTPTPTQTTGQCFASCMSTYHDASRCSGQCNTSPTPVPCAQAGRPQGLGGCCAPATQVRGICTILTPTPTMTQGQCMAQCERQGKTATTCIDVCHI